MDQRIIQQGRSFKSIQNGINGIKPYISSERSTIKIYLDNTSHSSSSNSSQSLTKNNLNLKLHSDRHSDRIITNSLSNNSNSSDYKLISKHSQHNNNNVYNIKPQNNNCNNITIQQQQLAHSHPSSSLSPNSKFDGSIEYFNFLNTQKESSQSQQKQIQPIQQNQSGQQQSNQQLQLQQYQCDYKKQQKQDQQIIGGVQGQKQFVSNNWMLLRKNSQRKISTSNNFLTEISSNQQQVDNYKNKQKLQNTNSLKHQSSIDNESSQTAAVKQNKIKRPATSYKPNLNQQMQIHNIQINKLNEKKNISSQQKEDLLNLNKQSFNITEEQEDKINEEDQQQIEITTTQNNQLENELNTGKKNKGMSTSFQSNSSGYEFNTTNNNNNTYKQQQMNSQQYIIPSRSVLGSTFCTMSSSTSSNNNNNNTACALVFNTEHITQQLVKQNLMIFNRKELYSASTNSHTYTKSQKSIYQQNQNKNLYKQYSRQFQNQSNGNNPITSFSYSANKSLSFKQQHSDIIPLTQRASKTKELNYFSDQETSTQLLLSKSILGNHSDLRESVSASGVKRDSLLIKKNNDSQIQSIDEDHLSPLSSSYQQKSNKNNKLIESEKSNLIKDLISKKTQRQIPLIEAPFFQNKMIQSDISNGIQNNNNKILEAFSPKTIQLQKFAYSLNINNFINHQIKPQNNHSQQQQQSQQTNKQSQKKSQANEKNERSNQKQNEEQLNQEETKLSQSNPIFQKSENKNQNNQTNETTFEQEEDQEINSEQPQSQLINLTKSLYSAKKNNTTQTIIQNKSEKSSFLINHNELFDAQNTERRNQEEGQDSDIESARSIQTNSNVGEIFLSKMSPRPQTALAYFHKTSNHSNTNLQNPHQQFLCKIMSTERNLVFDRIKGGKDNQDSTQQQLKQQQSLPIQPQQQNNTGVLNTQKQLTSRQNTYDYLNKQQQQNNPQIQIKKGIQQQQDVIEEVKKINPQLISPWQNNITSDYCGEDDSLDFIQYTISS